MTPSNTPCLDSCRLVLILTLFSLVSLPSSVFVAPRAKMSRRERGIADSWISLPDAEPSSHQYQHQHQHQQRQTNANNEVHAHLMLSGTPHTSGLGLGLGYGSEVTDRCTLTHKFMVLSVKYKFHRVPPHMRMSCVGE